MLLGLLLLILLLPLHTLQPALQTALHAALQTKPCSMDCTPEVTHEMYREIQPYLLPDEHPLKPTLDDIFCTFRATFNDEALLQAGFEVLFTKERSFVRVARHPFLPGHLVKAYLDCDTRQKNSLPGWVWLKRRCHGAQKIRSVIKKHKLKHFQVPKKWLYVLPSVPFSEQLSAVSPQPLLLLVQDMNLVSEEKNLEAWRTKITSKHLDELYTIIRKSGGSSYRPANIWMSCNGKFSFIDTEYPHRKPDFRRIRPYLSSAMRDYWDKLVNHRALKKRPSRKKPLHASQKRPPSTPNQS